jgi:hypothetical protein
VSVGHEASVNGGSAAAGGGNPLAGRLSLSADAMRTRPELLVGAAFVGGLVTAFLLRRLGR